MVAQNDSIPSGSGIRSMVRAAVAFLCRSAAEAGSTAITARATERLNSDTVCSARPGQHPGLHRAGRSVVELAHRRDQVRGLQIAMSPASSAASVAGSRRRSEVATQVRSPAVGRRQPQRGPDLVAGLLLGQPAALGGVGDRAQGALLRTVEHRPAPLPGPDQLDPVGVVQQVRVDPRQPGHRRKVGRTVGDQAHHLCAQPDLED